MQVMFTRWCIDPKGRQPVSVKPERVDCVEHFSEAFVAPYGEEFPAASKILMMGKQEYLVQGRVEDVVTILNEYGLNERSLVKYAQSLERKIDEIKGKNGGETG